MEQDIHSPVDNVVDNILQNYVDISPERQIVVLFDQDKAIIAEAMRRGITARGARPVLREFPQGARRLPKTVGRLLCDAQIGLVVLASHHMWRAGLASYLDPGADPVSLSAACQPLFFDAVIPTPSFLRLFGSGVADDRAYLRALAGRLPAHAPMRVTAPGGTDLQMVTRRWRAMTWEALTSPVESSVNGRIVADASVFCGMVASPICVELVHGRIVSIQCDDPSDEMFCAYARWMRQARHDSPGNRQLAEVGVGGNAQAILSGIIMEDEAMRNTCHFCFGDNVRYGGTNRSAWHGGTLVVRSPQFKRL